MSPRNSLADLRRVVVTVVTVVTAVLLSLSARVSTAAPPAVFDAEALMDWAEGTWPTLFAYPDGLTRSIVHLGTNFRARRYLGPEGPRWLGVDAQGQVTAPGDFTGGQPQVLGTVTDWADVVAREHCRIHPLDLSCGEPPQEHRLSVGMAEGLATVGPERRLVAWGRHIGPDAVADQGVRGLRRFALNVAGATAVNADGGALAWYCVPIQLPGGSTWCASSGPQRVRSAGRIVQLEGLRRAWVALRDDGRLWISDTASQEAGDTAPPLAAHVHGLPPLRALARSSGWQLQFDVLGLGLDDRVWVIRVVDNRAYALPLDGLPPIRAASCESLNCLALARDGRVWAWGDNSAGQLGQGGAWIGVQSTPQPVPGLADIDEVLVVGAAMFARGRDGRVWSWGGVTISPSAAQPSLGRNETGPVTRPTRVPGIDGAAELAGGGGVMLVRRQDGTVWGWGSNVAGLLDPRPLSASYFVAPVRVDLSGLDLR
jgi:hypothetical protein